MGSKVRGIFSPASKERIHKVLSNYSEKCSVNGVSFMRGSKYPAIRVLWTVLIIFAVTALAIHLGLLFSEYLSYRKQSVIELDFNILPFPAVTLCNVNPIRMSKIDLLNPKLRHLIQSFDPTRMKEIENEYVPDYAKDHDFRPYGMPPPSRTGAFNTSAPLDEFNTSTTTTNSIVASQQTTQNFASDTTLDDFSNTPDIMEDFNIDFNIDNFLNTGWDSDDSEMPAVISGAPGDGPDGEFNGYSGGGGGGQENKNRPRAAAVSTFTKIYAAFRILYSAEPAHIREQVGHPLKDILVQCSFGGRACQYSDFKHVSSNTYGNCYTLQYDKGLVADDGPLSGLDMILHLQVDEYVKGFTASKGAQIVVHQPGTIPFPEDEGFSVSAGMHSSVGLKMHDISRLGYPYGDCSDVDHFKHQYNIIYTRQTCQKLCQTEEIRKVCGCFDATGVSLTKILNFTDNIRPCRSEYERWCALGALEDLNRNGGDKCLCNNPCKEKKYAKTISSRMWPDEDYARAFIINTCNNVKGLNWQCESLKKKRGDQLRQEFLRVSVYYEDLNYQQLKEIPNYEVVQLVSDIGGTLGLWIGLSLLGFCEIIHLLVSLALTLCCPGVKNVYTRHTCGDVEESGEEKNKNSSPSLETTM